MEDKSIVPVNKIAACSSTYEFSNPNGAVVVEIDDDPVEVVEKQMEELKLDHQFNEKDVPEIFKTLINDRISGLKKVFLELKSCLLVLDNINIRFEKNADNWTVTYESNNIPIEVVDPEKSIIDHLWFVLKNPNINLKTFGILNSKESGAENRDSQRIDLKKLTTLLQSIINSIDHQIQTSLFSYGGLNEDMLFSLLKHFKSGIFVSIVLDFSWKKKFNYQELKKIHEMDQWKQAKIIFSSGVTSLKIDDLIHREDFCLCFEKITPEDVLLVVKNYLDSEDRKSCYLWCLSSNFDINATVNVLRSQIDGAEIRDIGPTSSLESFRFDIVKPGKIIFLWGDESHIAIMIR